MTVLLEPPTAIISMMAFSRASQVMIFRGVMPRCTMSTICWPLRRAQRSRSLNTAGIAAPPGKVMPRASARQHMLLAVPMNWQEPQVGAHTWPNRRTPASSISPTWSRPMASLTLVVSEVS